MTDPTHSLGFNGLTMGNMAEGDDFTILGQVGVKGLGQAPRRTQLADSATGGQVRGTSLSSSREITATVRTDDRDKMLALVNAMNPRANPDDLLPLTVTGLLWDPGAGTQRLYVSPERCEPEVNTQAVGLGDYRADLMWIAPDPVIYSDVLHQEPFGGESDGGPVHSVDRVFTNAGLSYAPSGRAWTLRFTAHGNVEDPYITNLDNEDQSVRFVGLTMTSGQVLEVHEDRTCMVGDRHVEGLIRSRGSKFPYWPVQRPGTNTWRVGAITGNVSGLIRHRDTWTR